ncbi:MAG: BrnT family toxin [Deltaproteobacteria bacterium]|nr:BrnT family toxin [Deltaproteobacteria bacterium]
MAQWRFVEWLLFWLLETQTFEFEWDEGNRTKNEQKHGISIYEVETVFRSGSALPLGIQISPPVLEQRLGVVGPSLLGRLLQVAFILREGRVRVISARPAHRKERKHYEEILRKISQRI